MRAGWFALIVGLVVGGGLAMAIVAPATPSDDGLGPVLEALDLERGPALDARRAAAVAGAAERCLVAAGIRASVPVEPPPAIPDADLDPVTWAERWGFGITTAAGLAVSGVTTIEAALPDAAGRRCRDEAAEAVYGLRDRLLAPLRPALEALGATIDADPASRAADAAWVTCAERVIVDADAPLPAPSAPGQLEGLRTWFAGHGPRPPAAIVDLERRVAAGIARCDLVRVDARRAAAAPHERQFVAAHRDELARIGAAIRAAEDAYPSAPVP